MLGRLTLEQVTEDIRQFNQERLGPLVRRIHVSDPDLALWDFGRRSVWVELGAIGRNWQWTNYPILDVGFFRRTKDHTCNSPSLGRSPAVKVRQRVRLVWGVQVDYQDRVVPIASFVRCCEVQTRLIVEELDDAGRFVVGQLGENVRVGRRDGRRGGRVHDRLRGVIVTTVPVSMRRFGLGGGFGSWSPEGHRGHEGGRQEMRQHRGVEWRSGERGENRWVRELEEVSLRWLYIPSHLTSVHPHFRLDTGRRGIFGRAVHR